MQNPRRGSCIVLSIVIHGFAPDVLEVILKEGFSEKAHSKHVL